jgi:DNA-binding NtrC family response regulator
MERALQRAGHVVQAFSGAEAFMQALSQAKPHAICLDASLPGLSGPTAIELIRKRSANSRMILLSSDRNVRGAVDAVRAGAWDYLTKPVTTDALVQCVTEALSSGRSNGSTSAMIDIDAAITLDELERAAIEAALRRTRGNVTRAMKQLGIGRTTLYRKLKRYGLR